MQAAPTTTVAANGLRLGVTLRLKNAIARACPIAAMAGPGNPAANPRPMRGVGRDGQFSHPHGELRDIGRNHGHLLP